MTADAKRWRWIESPPGSGPLNMAIDEAILLAYQDRCVPPTIRVYAWNPPCVSLGYFQSARDVHQELCQERGIDLVRRLTGGRAILHQDELTYSVVVDEGTLGARGVVASFRRICSAIIAGLQRVGIEAELKATKDRLSDRRAADAACFATAARCDLMCKDRKVVGSAQVRRANALLQQGSLPLTFGFDLARELLPGASDLRSKVIDARTAAGKPALSAHCLAQALRCGFREAFDLEPVDDELTADERRCAQELCARKYSNVEWTCRR